MFIHGNYPAQFRHLAPLLSNDGKNRVIYLTARDDAEQEPLAGVEIGKFECHRLPNEATHHYLTSTEEGVLKGQAITRKIIELLGRGFNPRIVITHGGMGLGLYIKDLLPATTHIGYFEWYFRHNTSKHLIQNFDLNAKFQAGMRNLIILQELEMCDIGVVPTKWQKEQFPKEFSDKLRVIFDGISKEFFYPTDQTDNLKKVTQVIRNRETGQTYKMKAGSKILSYATRGMEPLRGFPEFMRAIPKLITNNPDLYVFIAGADRRAYSYDAPTNDGSWRLHILEELGEFCGKERIFFTGLLNYEDYRLMLWRSDLHCYLTRPYVTSWSLFEAASCGARLAVNKCKATENIAVESSITWLDLDGKEKLADQLDSALNNKEIKKSKIHSGYELNENLKKWVDLINSFIS